MTASYDASVPIITKFAAAVPLKRISLWLPPDALGRSFAIRTTEGQFDITFPIADGQGGLQAPYIKSEIDGLDGLEVPQRFWGRLYRDLVGIGAVAITGRAVMPAGEEEVGVPPEWAVGWNVVHAFFKWYDVASSWLEIWRGSATSDETSENHDAWVKLEGEEEFWEMPDYPADYRGFFDGPETFTFAQLTMVMVNAAFELASRQQSPPVEWLTLFDALRSTDARLAVIEAATAAEISFSKAIERVLASQGLSQVAIENKMKRVNGLTPLKRQSDSLNATKRLHDVKDLADPRNEALHEGRAPAKPEVVYKAIDIAHGVLLDCSPILEWKDV